MVSVIPHDGKLDPPFAARSGQPVRGAELIRRYLWAGHRHRLILPVGPPGEAARSFRAGANLAPERAAGHRTWEDFLTERLR